MFVTDRDGMSNLYRGPSIDAPYQDSVHWAEGVSEEKIKMWQINGPQTTDDGRQVMAKAFRPDPLTNMTATGDSCFWLADF
jgi:hypothetical protein